jgi:hypothetical protein
MRAALILNSAAGRLSRLEAPRAAIEAVMAESGFTVLSMPAAPLDAQWDAALAAGAEAVFIAGGDGTLRGFARRLMDTRLPCAAAAGRHHEPALRPPGPARPSRSTPPRVPARSPDGVGRPPPSTTSRCSTRASWGGPPAPALPRDAARRRLLRLVPLILARAAQPSCATPGARSRCRSARTRRASGVAAVVTLPRPAAARR